MWLAIHSGLFTTYTMKHKQLISRDIELFYTRVSEETRLEKGMGVFEFERIKSLIEKYITVNRATVIDVGGGTGKYAEWLARKGHRIHLVDPVLKHIHTAQRRANTLKNKFSVHQGESQRLDFPDNFADIIILHGPLYHLQKREDRVQAIREAQRILKSNGVLLGFAINYTASTLVGLLQGLIHKKSFFRMCKEELTTGIHNPPTDFPWLLAEAYYHKSAKLKDEFTEQGLHYINTHAVEGLAWLDKSFYASMLDERKRETLLELIQITESDSSLLSFSPHLMIAAKK